MMSMQSSYYNQYSSPRCLPLVTKESQQDEETARRLDDLSDTLQVMLRLEAQYHVATRDPTAETWKPVVVQWMYSVVEVFDLVPRIVPTAMNFLDRSMYKMPSEEFHLLGLACLSLAIKVHDTKMFPMDQLMRIGQANVSVDQLIEMERRLLKVLAWKLHPTTPQCFLHQFVTLVPDYAVEAIRSKALFLIRQGLLLNLPQSPSILAYASLLAAMEHDLSLSTQVKQTFCVHVLKVAGLSATTPGLAEAYQALVPQHPRNMSNMHPSAPSRPASPVAQQAPTLSPCSSPSSHCAPYTGHMLLSPSPSQELDPFSNVVYSAGEDLGFEIVNCTVSSSSQKEDNPFGQGMSPRNITGAVSPPQYR
eukprot:Nitzschia sp. Nitz4//scaffold186_size43309//37472//38560//NITZ4_007325-RA/size43309-processed-gene-0.10-mRNA-1//-1//CDS//3329539782//3967//frame0